MFWRQYETMYSGIFDGHVDWGALWLCVPNWVVMVLVICLANMLEMSTTESALQA